MEVRIKQGKEIIDATIEMVDGVMVVSPKEVKFEPKDGDVVYSKGYREYVFVYKDNLTMEAYFYAALSIEDNKIEFPDGGRHIGYVSQLRPATEEKKKLLFDKLAEEGYEFDFDKKELVKLKWKPGVGVDYYTPSFNMLEFEPYLSGWDEDETDLILYEIGWIFKTEQECQEFCNRLNEAINSVKP